MLDAQTAPAHYLIHASDQTAMLDFLGHAELDPEIRILDRIGAPDAPHTLVVELSGAKARALAQQFRNTSPQLTIEPDQPLTMFDMLSAGPL
ncbi:hypothetical protein [Duganella fentianensis]|uniref:hypothetical protein n=1 Tax=Duganella fentianensis TaxID=2692177 RepID=UPI0032B20EFC